MNASEGNLFDLDDEWHMVRRCGEGALAADHPGPRLRLCFAASARTDAAGHGLRPAAHRQRRLQVRRVFSFDDRKAMGTPKENGLASRILTICAGI